MLYPYNCLQIASQFVVIIIFQVVSQILLVLFGYLNALRLVSVRVLTLIVSLLLCQVKLVAYLWSIKDETFIILERLQQAIEWLADIIFYMTGKRENVKK